MVSSSLRSQGRAFGAALGGRCFLQSRNFLEKPVGTMPQPSSEPPAILLRHELEFSRGKLSDPSGPLLTSIPLVHPGRASLAQAVLTSPADLNAGPSSPDGRCQLLALRRVCPAQDSPHGHFRVWPVCDAHPPQRPGSMPTNFSVPKSMRNYHRLLSFKTPLGTSSLSTGALRALGSPVPMCPCGDPTVLDAGCWFSLLLG